MARVAGEPYSVDDQTREVERLFDLYADRLQRHIYHYIRSWEITQDLVQDLFLRLWDRRAELGSIADLEGYLYTAARNRALTYLRQARHEEQWRLRDPSPIQSPADQAVSAEIAAAVQRAVDALPVRQREALLLQWKGHSYAEIAAALEISPKTVAIHLSRAIKHLRHALQRLR